MKTGCHGTDVVGDIEQTIDVVQSLLHVGLHRHRNVIEIKTFLFVYFFNESSQNSIFLFNK